MQKRAKNYQNLQELQFFQPLSQDLQKFHAVYPFLLSIFHSLLFISVTFLLRKIKNPQP